MRSHPPTYPSLCRQLPVWEPRYRIHQYGGGDLRNVKKQNNITCWYHCWNTSFPFKCMFFSSHRHNPALTCITCLFTDTTCETKNSHVSQGILSSLSMMGMWRMSSPMERRSCLSVSRDKTIWTHFSRPSTLQTPLHILTHLFYVTLWLYTLFRRSQQEKQE